MSERKSKLLLQAPDGTIYEAETPALTAETRALEIVSIVKRASEKVGVALRIANPIKIDL